MEIVIIKEFSQVQKDANELAWKIYRKKSFNSFLLILTAGLLLLLSGAFSKYESSFWNFRTSIGIGFLLMASFSLLKIFELKSTLFSLHKKNTIKNEEEFVEYSISDNGITCKSKNSSSQTTWANYKFYKFLYGFIVLYAENSDIYSWIINEKDLSEIQHTVLINFINERLIIKA